MINILSFLTLVSVSWALGLSGCASVVDVNENPVVAGKLKLQFITLEGSIDSVGSDSLKKLDEITEKNLRRNMIRLI